MANCCDTKQGTKAIISDYILKSNWCLFVGLLSSWLTSNKDYVKMSINFGPPTLIGKNLQFLLSRSISDDDSENNKSSLEFLDIEFYRTSC